MRSRSILPEELLSSRHGGDWHVAFEDIAPDLPVTPIELDALERLLGEDLKHFFQS